MAKECFICKNKTIFYVWSTSRRFPKEKLIKYKDCKTKLEKARIAIEGQPVCFGCLEELKKMKL